MAFRVPVGISKVQVYKYLHYDSVAGNISALPWVSLASFKRIIVKRPMNEEVIFKYRWADYIKQTMEKIHDIVLENRSVKLCEIVNILGISTE